jgi:acyl-CoA hydrolase
MHVAVDVRARDPMDDGGERLCTHCVIVFVAVDEAGKPVQVPAWTPVSDEDKRLSEYATQVMALSKGIEQTVARYRDAID